MTSVTGCLLLVVVFNALLYSVTGQCSGTTTILTADATIKNLTGPTATSGGSTQYAQTPYLCSWLISPAAGYQQIVIYFQTFSTESSSSCGSSDDYVIVVDGNSRTGGFNVGCLSGALATVVTQGLRTIATGINHQIYIEFVADGDSVTGTGFWVKYVARAQVTETSSGLSTGALIGIVVGVLAAVLVVIVIVVVVVIKKQQRQIDEMEWSEYDSDDYYDSDESEYEGEDEESRPEAPAPRTTLPALSQANPLGVNRAAIDVPTDYKAPGALPSLNREDIEKEKKKARRRRRRRKKRQSSVAPTANGQGRRATFPREQTAMSVSTVATARAVVIGSNGNVAYNNADPYQQATAPDKTLSDLEDEIAGPGGSQPTEHTISTTRPRDDDDDPVFSSNNFKPAGRNSIW